MPLAVDLIVNPTSGPPSRRLARHQRLAHATRALEALGVSHVRGIETTGPGDAAAAASRAAEDAVSTVVVWGGDGTLNEVATQLLGSPTTLGIVPGGSGNGLARALGLPMDIDAALAVAVRGATCAMDVGRVNGRPFFNIAGVGLDAAIAQRFNTIGGRRRGLVSYLRACGSELRVHGGGHYRVAVDGRPWFEGAADIVAIANGQQYGHGAHIAPHARLDDGWMDVVVVTDVTVGRMLRYGWRLFTGSIDGVPGIHSGRARAVDVVPPPGALLHVDGEMQDVAGPLTFATQPRALVVQVPVTADDAAARSPGQA
jgi:YegS/Rv2252/BmrU family lipid kinase